MGICQQFSYLANNQINHSIETLTLKSGPQFNRINFKFTNTSVIQLKGDCLVFYLDHVSELSQTQILNRLKPKTRRKILQYLKLAEQQTEKNLVNHSLIPLAVPSLRFDYLLFVKIQPWDGVSREQLQKKIYYLTTTYLQVFSLRKFKKLTIVEFDLCLGIHYSVGYQMIAKAIEKYCLSIKSVNLLCNTFETVKFSFMYFKKYGAGKETEESKKINNPKHKRKIQKRKLRDDIFF